jgi:capsular polysaccharide biosynthesis protein
VTTARANDPSPDAREVEAQVVLLDGGDRRTGPARAVVFADVPGFAAVAIFLRRHGWLILGTAAAVGVLVFLAARFLVGPVYEASATLVIAPPQFSSQLKPEVLTMQGYQRLLHSDAVVSDTRRRLVQEGVLSKDSTLRVGEELTSRIFVSRRSEETSLAPVIELVARSEAKEDAARIANTWAAVFLERSHHLLSASLAPSLELIDSEYGLRRDELQRLESQQREVAVDFQRRIDDLTGIWDRRLADATTTWDGRLVARQQETLAAAARYQAESRQAIEQLSKDSLGPAGEMSGNSPSLGQELRQVVSLRIHLAQTPEILVLVKGLSDDAVWQRDNLVDSELLRLRPGEDKSLVTEEVNPVYVDLALRTAHAEAALAGGGENSAEVANAPPVGTFLASLERLQRERSSGLARLQAEGALALETLRRNRKLALDELLRQRALTVTQLHRERDAVLAAIDRDLAVGTSLFEELANSHNQATLARKEQTLVDVRLASAATPPEQPLRSRLLLQAVLGCLLGGLLGLMLAIGREVAPPAVR